MASVHGHLVQASNQLVITRAERDAILEGVAGRLAFVAERLGNLYGTQDASAMFAACRDEFRKLSALADVIGWEDEGLHCGYAIPDADYLLQLSANYCDVLAESVAYTQRLRRSEPGERAHGSLEPASDWDKQMIEQDKHAEAILRAMLARSSRK